jgi:hypothetical protein
LPLEIQLYRRDCWDPINVCLHMFCRWKSSYIDDGWDPINVCLYICVAVGDPVILKGLLGSH